MLEVSNLAKSFGNRQILKNISFTLADGEILTVVGPSGAGKTTPLADYRRTRNGGRRHHDPGRADLPAER